jgi:hypothetical protein
MAFFSHYDGNEGVQSSLDTSVWIAGSLQTRSSWEVVIQKISLLLDIIPKQKSELPPLPMTRMDVKACYHSNPTPSASLHCSLVSETTSSHEALAGPTTQNLPVPDTSRPRIEVFECAFTVYCPWLAGILWFLDVIHHQDLCIALPGHFTPGVIYVSSTFCCGCLSFSSVSETNRGSRPELGYPVSLCPSTVLAVCARSSRESPRRSLVNSVVASSSEPARIPPTKISRSFVRLVTDRSSRFKPSDLVKPSGVCH